MKLYSCIYTFSVGWANACIFRGMGSVEAALCVMKLPFAEQESMLLLCHICCGRPTLMKVGDVSAGAVLVGGCIGTGMPHACAALSAWTLPMPSAAPDVPPHAWHMLRPACAVVAHQGRQLQQHGLRGICDDVHNRVDGVRHSGVVALCVRIPATPPACVPRIRGSAAAAIQPPPSRRVFRARGGGDSRARLPRCRMQ